MSSPGTLKLENRHTGEVLELRRRWRNGELVLELSGTLPPHREGPPMHIHYHEDEEGTVISGRLSAIVGGKRLDLGPGKSGHLPRRVPHRWWNEGDEPLAFAGHVSPLVDLDRFLQAIFEVANAGPPNRPPMFYLAHVLLRYRRSHVVTVIPPPVQVILFGAVVALGTLLGKYRGTAWPGCPARCTGAPECGANGAP